MFTTYWTVTFRTAMTNPKTISRDKRTFSKYWSLFLLHLITRKHCSLYNFLIGISEINVSIGIAITFNCKLFKDSFRFWRFKSDWLSKTRTIQFEIASKAETTVIKKEKRAGEWRKKGRRKWSEYNIVVTFNWKIIFCSQFQQHQYEQHRINTEQQLPWQMNKNAHRIVRALRCLYKFRIRNRPSPPPPFPHCLHTVYGIHVFCSCFYAPSFLRRVCTQCVYR